MPVPSKIRDLADAKGIPEVEFVSQIVEEEQGNVARASRRLNVTRAALEKFMSRHRLAVIAKVIRLTPELYPQKSVVSERIANPQ